MAQEPEQPAGGTRAERIASGDWSEFFDAVAGLPPRETLVRALDAFEAEDRDAAEPVWRVGVDIGCGEGRDTREMLRRAGPTRWRVMACDSSVEGIKRLGESVEPPVHDRLLATACAMEDLPRSFRDGPRVGGTRRLERQADLVSSSFALPHCRADAFPTLWAWIVGILRPGGRFAGQLFGVNDEFAKKPDGLMRVHHTRAQVEELLRGFEVEQFEEIERMGKNAFGEPKYWHVFHIVARKR